MRIVHVVTLVSNDGAFGGPLRVALNQVEGLRARGHDVELVAGWRGPSPAPHDVDGVPVTLFPVRQLVPGSGFSGLYSRDLRRGLRRVLTGCDVLHVHAGRDLVSLTALAQARRAGVPSVVQTHGMVATDARTKARVTDALATRRLVGGAGCHLVLTDEEERQLPALLGKGVRMRRIGNGVVVRPDRTSVTSAPLDVLYCARLHARKRPTVFVEVAGQLRDRHSDVTFSLVGPDEGELPAVRAGIAALGPGARVRYEGALGYDAVADRMARSAVYVLPSVDEPFPMSLLEAMSLGLACVCTDTCGISSVLRQVGAALVTDGSVQELSRAVHELLDDAARREELGGRARRAVERHFSIDAVVTELEEAYALVQADSAAVR